MVCQIQENISNFLWDKKEEPNLNTTEKSFDLMRNIISMPDINLNPNWPWKLAYANTVRFPVNIKTP
jgi:hypothetical protein